MKVNTSAVMKTPFGTDIKDSDGFVTAKKIMVLALDTRSDHPTPQDFATKIRIINTLNSSDEVEIEKLDAEFIIKCVLACATPTVHKQICDLLGEK